ncbi:MAG: hypothetical protein IV093_05890 [Rubrivivax sp.]|nr:hypothetical protein [Rubrivivax sp.]
MNVMRTADVVARVVAWHNRHPLARRITPDQVSGVGIVVLPFALKGAPATAADGDITAADTPALGDTAAPAELTPIFGDDWLFRPGSRRLGDWTRLHGAYPLHGVPHWPLRQVEADLALSHRADAEGLEGRTARHLVTAVVDAGGQRVRLLLRPGPMAQAPVFGPRLYSLPRLGGLAGAGVTASLALGLAALLRPTAPGHPTVVAQAASAPQPVVVAASAPALAASSAGASAHAETAAASAPTSASAPHADAVHVADAASAPATPAEVVLPADVRPQRSSRAAGDPPLARIRPQLTEDERREARLQATSLRTPSATAAASAASGASAPALQGPVYALATPPVRNRDDALAQQVLLQGMKAQVKTPVPTQLDLMSAQGRWRVVWWPHPQQQEAQALLLQARARGLKVELIAF